MDDLTLICYDLVFYGCKLKLMCLFSWVRATTTSILASLKWLPLTWFTWHNLLKMFSVVTFQPWLLPCRRQLTRSTSMSTRSHQRKLSILSTKSTRYDHLWCLHPICLTYMQKLVLWLIFPLHFVYVCSQETLVPFPNNQNQSPSCSPRPSSSNLLWQLQYLVSDYNHMLASYHPKTTAISSHNFNLII